MDPYLREMSLNASQVVPRVPPHSTRSGGERRPLLFSALLIGFSPFLGTAGNCEQHHIFPTQLRDLWGAVSLELQYTRGTDTEDLTCFHTFHMRDFS